MLASTRCLCGLQTKSHKWVITRCLDVRWCRYQGGRTYDAFLKFLEDQLEADKGFARSPALDKLASAFLGSAAEGDRSGIITQAWHTPWPGACCSELADGARRPILYLSSI